MLAGNDPKTSWRSGFGEPPSSEQQMSAPIYITTKSNRNTQNTARSDMAKPMTRSDNSREILRTRTIRSSRNNCKTLSVLKACKLSSTDPLSPACNQPMGVTTQRSATVITHTNKSKKPSSLHRPRQSRQPEPQLACSASGARGFRKTPHLKAARCNANSAMKNNKQTDCTTKGMRTSLECSPSRLSSSICTPMAMAFTKITSPEKSSTFPLFNHACKRLW
mmetsp:Transcript_69772/g.213948  ORF Transcript_69772/g.213948 Transcript_69772/m.213948 type:complete len:221 (-) Transcript_69772:186-848(-)